MSKDYDGTILIGAKLSTTELEKDISKMEKFGNKVNSAFKGLAATIAGLSLVNFISSIGVVLANSKELQTKIKQIGQIITNVVTQLAQIVAPMVEKVVNWIYKLFVYIGYILNAWFGIDAFAKSTNKSLKSGAKSAKEIKKQLAGFDEMNVLNKNTGTSGIGGGLGAIDISNIEIPDWVKDIAQNKNKYVNILKEIAYWIGVAFATTKIIQFVNWLSKLTTNTGLLKGLFKETAAGSGVFRLDLVKTLGVLGGIAIAVYGVVEAVKGFITWVKDPSWKNFQGVLKGLSTAVMGVGTALVFLNASNPVGWILLAIGAVSKFVAIIGKDKVQVISLKDAQKELNDATQDYINMQDEYVNAIDNAEQAHKDLINAENKNKLSGEALYKEVENGTKKYEKMTDAEKEVYKAYLKDIGAEQNLKKVTGELEESRKTQLKKSLQLANATLAETGNYKDLKDALIKAYKEGAITADEAAEDIAASMSLMSDETKHAFAEELPDDLKTGLSKLPFYLDKYVPKDIKINASVKIDENKVKLAVDKVKKTLGSLSVAHFAKGGIINVPKLAVGGIINRPGRGIPLAGGGAIGGERGAEAVVPLTDSQQMQLLGEAIGKYVSVNFENKTYIGNRQVAREIKKINANESFAYNG